MIHDTAAVTLPGASTVEVRRSFRAPRKLVWRAFTVPKLVQQWMLGPPGWSMPVCDMDVRVGGGYRWRWRSDEDGKSFGFHGVYQEVTPGAKLVHTEFFDPGDVGGDMGEGALITLTLQESNGVTTAITLMDFHTKEARDAAVATGMTDGMEMSYQGLDRVLSAAGA